MRELVAIDVDRSIDAFAIVNRVWDAGNAAMIIDQRLPAPAKSDLVKHIGVHRVATSDEIHALPGSHEPMNDDDALVLATSGTSGAPKGVVHTHASLRAASLATSAALGCGAESHWLACLPPAHIGGFGVITRAWHTGAKLTILDGFDAEVVGNSEATHVSLVSTALQRIDPARFSRILLGGAKPPSDLTANVTTTYGLTESCGGIVYNRKPIPGVDVAIGDDGEVLLRGPMLMSRYRYAIGTVAHPIDTDGWLHTNDIGAISDGLLSVSGRRGDLIITGGENVWPDVVEERLRTHPDIDDCAVAGVADPEWGQAVTAWIVVRPETEPTLEELRDHVSETMPRFAAPRRVIYVAALPRTALGKIMRAALVSTLDD